MLDELGCILHLATSGPHLPRACSEHESRAENHGEALLAGKVLDSLDEAALVVVLEQSEHQLQPSREELQRLLCVTNLLSSRCCLCWVVDSLQCHKQRVEEIVAHEQD